MLGPPSPCQFLFTFQWGGDGGLSHFSGLHRRDTGQIGIFGEDWLFRWGDFFKAGLDNYMHENSECKSQTKKIILITNIRFLETKWVFLHLLARGWKNIKFLENLISCLGEGGQVIYFYSHLQPSIAINEESFKLKNS